MRSSGPFGRRCALGVVLGVSAGLTLCLPAQAWAATPITVCSSGCDYAAVQDAINAANPGGRILIGPGTYAGTSGPANPAVTVDKSLTLVGAGENQTTLGIGNAYGPIIQINAGVLATIKGVTVRGDYSAADVSNDGTLLLSDSTVTGGGLPAGISNNGLLSAYNLTVTDNFGNNGGGIANGGTMALSDSTVTGNYIITNGGGIGNGGTLVVNDSTISGNIALADSISAGGGIFNTGQAFVDGSTISGNLASRGGGIFSSAGSSTTLFGTKVTNNTAELPTAPNPNPGGGGILFGGKLTLLATTVSCNTDLSFTGTSTPDDIYNFNGTGTLTRFASRIGGCPVTATAAAARAPLARRAALARLDRALWAAALHPPGENAHLGQTGRKALRVRVRVLRQEAELVQKSLGHG